MTMLISLMRSIGLLDLNYAIIGRESHTLANLGNDHEFIRNISSLILRHFGKFQSKAMRALL